MARPRYAPARALSRVADGLARGAFVCGAYLLRRLSITAPIYGALGESGSQVCRRETGGGVGAGGSARARLTRRDRAGAAAVGVGTTSAATIFVTAGPFDAGGAGVAGGSVAAGSATSGGGACSTSVFHFFAASPPASAKTAANVVNASPRAHFRPPFALLRVGPNASVAVR